MSKDYIGTQLPGGIADLRDTGFEVWQRGSWKLLPLQDIKDLLGEGGGGSFWTRDSGNGIISPNTASDAIWLGDNAKDFYAQGNPIDVLIAGHNTAKGDPSGTFLGLACGDPDDVYTSLEVWADASICGVFAHISSGENINLSLSTEGGTLQVSGHAGATGLRVEPGIEDGQLYFHMDTGGVVHTSGDIARFDNNGAALFGVNWAGNITAAGSVVTGDPGAGAAEWKLGQVKTGVVALDTAHYVEVSIGGAVKKLLIAS
jgi:hypothetical protein